MAWAHVSVKVGRNRQETKQERKRFYWCRVSTRSVLSCRSLLRPGDPVCAASELDAPPAPSLAAPLLHYCPHPVHLPVSPPAPVSSGRTQMSRPST